MSSTLLTGACIPGLGRRDVRATDGTVAEVGTLTPGPDEDVHELTGYLLLPSLVEPHVHLDKVFSAPTEPIADLPPLSGLRDAIGRHESTIDRIADTGGPGPAGRRSASVAERADRALRMYLTNGTTAVRCHVGCGRAIDTASLAAVLEVRERLRGLIDVQIVADIGWRKRGVHWSEHARHLAMALDAGADLVGGYPSLDPEPEEAIDAGLAVAREYGRGVDFHLDEVMDPDEQDVRHLAHRVRTDPLAGPVTASHCVALGCCEPVVQREIAAEIAAAGIGVITNPMTNLYLQDRPAAQMRGLTAIQALQDAGVVTAAGSDNIQDAFNPVGRCDPLEVASLLVTAAQCDVADALAMVSDAARAVLGLPAAGPRVGAVADLLAIRCDSVGSAVATAPPDRLVFTAGRLVARSRFESWIARPASTTDKRTQS